MREFKLREHTPTRVRTRVSRAGVPPRSPSPLPRITRRVSSWSLVVPIRIRDSRTRTRGLFATAVSRASFRVRYIYYRGSSKEQEEITRDCKRLSQSFSKGASRPSRTARVLLRSFVERPTSSESSLSDRRSLNKTTILRSREPSARGGEEERDRGVDITTRRRTPMHFYGKS